MSRFLILFLCFSAFAAELKPITSLEKGVNSPESKDRLEAAVYLRENFISANWAYFFNIHPADLNISSAGKTLARLAYNAARDPSPEVRTASKAAWQQISQELFRTAREVIRGEPETSSDPKAFEQRKTSQQMAARWMDELAAIQLEWKRQRSNVGSPVRNQAESGLTGLPIAPDCEAALKASNDWLKKK